MISTSHRLCLLRSLTTFLNGKLLVFIRFRQFQCIVRISSNHTTSLDISRMLEGWYFGERDTKRNGQIVESPSHDQRGSLVDKASSVQRSSNAKAKAYHVTHLRESTKEDLKGVEANMKYGLFCLTLMYFRALHILRKEKATWDGSNGGSSSTPMSEERKKMIQESKNAEFRIALMEYAMQKAKSGAERKMRKLEQERLEAVCHVILFISTR
jgi:hypothetical protein